MSEITADMIASRMNEVRVEIESELKRRFHGLRDLRVAVSVTVYDRGPQWQATVFADVLKLTNGTGCDVAWAASLEQLPASAVSIVAQSLNEAIAERERLIGGAA